MQITVLLFATLRDLTQERSVMLILPQATSTVGEVRQAMMRRFPDAAANFASALAAVNEEYGFDEEAVRDGDSVAFFPPVSGGSGLPEHFAVSETPVDHDAIVVAITTPAVGAVAFFSGMVRGTTVREGHIPSVDYLEYEAYTPMALAKMRQVAQEIRKQWPKVVGIAMVQRVGRLAVGQNTVLVACSAPHRDDGCFEASRYGIDRLKEIVPVWKKEIGLQGETWIEGEYRPNRADKAE